ncbi:uncharacterized protein MONOS_10567 [Monocercomonoides exilis]|uniref:uncharacterized protein n=1 Tax=Monocercomonoides exilis TaxID=2049356 RepID=UPI0035598727|nr:hypothetical protein MONOS_10567 [Monocercomonoides exilis]|eukprot:MONOS_10567.1-p1 / transcript=MONOS_10567.1 / gene=MONOS_10567 / organism=Monocercomonoides_exilis_PA203 / gene_product=unspecified product / transcript_product=unspecified product / location=Mono_scaffold00485:29343-32398(+) / protein_length=989 / sequence_SO=supercontig / SO=protein_coding / is_pseudo=false
MTETSNYRTPTKCLPQRKIFLLSSSNRKQVHESNPVDESDLSSKKETSDISSETKNDQVKSDSSLNFFGSSFETMIPSPFIQNVLGMDLKRSEELRLSQQKEAREKAKRENELKETESKLERSSICDCENESSTGRSKGMPTKIVDQLLLQANLQRILPQSTLYPSIQFGHITSFGARNILSLQNNPFVRLQSQPMLPAHTVATMQKRKEEELNRQRRENQRKVVFVGLQKMKGKGALLKRSNSRKSKVKLKLDCCKEGMNEEKENENALKMDSDSFQSENGDSDMKSNQEFQNSLLISASHELAAKLRIREQRDLPSADNSPERQKLLQSKEMDLFQPNQILCSPSSDFLNTFPEMSNSLCKEASAELSPPDQHLPLTSDLCPSFASPEFTSVIQTPPCNAVDSSPTYASTPIAMNSLKALFSETVAPLSLPTPDSSFGKEDYTITSSDTFACLSSSTLSPSISVNDNSSSVEPQTPQTPQTPPTPSTVLPTSATNCESSERLASAFNSLIEAKRTHTPARNSLSPPIPYASSNSPAKSFSSQRKQALNSCRGNSDFLFPPSLSTDLCSALFLSSPSSKTHNTLSTCFGQSTPTSHSFLPASSATSSSASFSSCLSPQNSESKPYHYYPPFHTHSHCSTPSPTSTAVFLPPVSFAKGGGTTISPQPPTSTSTASLYCSFHSKNISPSPDCNADQHHAQNSCFTSTKDSTTDTIKRPLSLSFSLPLTPFQSHRLKRIKYSSKTPQPRPYGLNLKHHSFNTTHLLSEKTHSEHCSTTFAPFSPSPHQHHPHPQVGQSLSEGISVDHFHCEKKKSCKKKTTAGLARERSVLYPLTDEAFKIFSAQTNYHQNSVVLPSLCSSSHSEKTHISITHCRAYAKQLKADSAISGLSSTSFEEKPDPPNSFTLNSSLFSNSAHRILPSERIKQKAKRNPDHNIVAASSAHSKHCREQIQASPDAKDQSSISSNYSSQIQDERHALHPNRISLPPIG